VGKEKIKVRGERRGGGGGQKNTERTRVRHINAAPVEFSSGKGRGYDEEED
jgi:hypothetical protein